MINSDKHLLFSFDEELTADNSFACKSESHKLIDQQLVSMSIEKFHEQATLAYQLLKVSMKLQFLNCKHEQSASLEVTNSDSTTAFVKCQTIFRSAFHTILYKIVNYFIYCQFIL